MSVRVFIVLKLAREPYNLTPKKIIEVLRDCAAVVELHADENQNLTEEDKVYVTERFCWETICKFPRPEQRSMQTRCRRTACTDATAVCNSNDPFPGTPPINPLRKIVPCPGCFWMEQRRIDCPFIRILFCPVRGHGNYRIDFGPDNDENCPKCVLEEEKQVSVDGANDLKARVGGFKKWYSKVAKKLKRVKVADKLKEIRVEEKSKKANAKRRSSFFMGGGVGMLVPYIQPVESG